MNRHQRRAQEAERRKILGHLRRAERGLPVERLIPTTFTEKDFEDAVDMTETVGTATATVEGNTEGP